MSSRVFELPDSPRAQAQSAFSYEDDDRRVQGRTILADIGDGVDIWTFRLDGDEAAAARDQPLLSADEAARAVRFRRVRDRRRFAAGRAALRRILAAYLQVDPASLVFSYGPAGKPAVADQPVTCTLQFNLSHSEDWALLAVTWGRAIGVDLELMRATGDQAAIAERFFAPIEAAALAGLAPPLREEAFFAIWTRKEALLKAFGAGLSLPLDGFCVATHPRLPAALVSVDCRPNELGRWSLMDIPLEPPLARRFRAALAIEGSQPTCRHFRLADSSAAAARCPGAPTSADY